VATGFSSPSQWLLSASTFVTVERFILEIRSIGLPQQIHARRRSAAGIMLAVVASDMLGGQACGAVHG